jgi:nicotinamide mononucleotide (NMN) deamidase PncC
VSQWLAEAAAGSKSFLGGVMIRDPGGLSNVLDIAHVSESTADAQMATVMAQAAQYKFGADFALGIAALPTDGPQQPTAATSSHGAEMSGTLHVAIATSDNVKVKGFPLASHPAITKARSAKQALNMLRLALLNT